MIDVSTLGVGLVVYMVVIFYLPYTCLFKLLQPCLLAPVHIAGSSSDGSEAEGMFCTYAAKRQSIYIVNNSCRHNTSIVLVLDDCHMPCHVMHTTLQYAPRDM